MPSSEGCSCLDEVTGFLLHQGAPAAEQLAALQEAVVALHHGAREG